MLNLTISRYAVFTTLLLAWGLPICVHPQDSPGYNFRGIASSIEEFDANFPIKGKWSGEIDLQLLTQSDYVDENANPFKHLQRVHIRPWLHYNGFRNIQLSFSTSYMRKYNIPETGVRESDEVRVSLMGMFTHPKNFGSIYEQFRFEARNIRSSEGDWLHFPRFRFRFGQKFNLGKSEKKPRLVVFQEIIFKIREHQKAYDIGRVFVGYGFKLTRKTSVTAGILAQAALKSNGQDVDVLFGPKFTLKYVFGKPKTPEHSPDHEID